MVSQCPALGKVVKILVSGCEDNGPEETCNILTTGAELKIKFNLESTMLKILSGLPRSLTVGYIDNLIDGTGDYVTLKQIEIDLSKLAGEITVNFLKVTLDFANFKLCIPFPVDIGGADFFCACFNIDHYDYSQELRLSIQRTINKLHYEM
jgi:hypothetical protein